MVEVTGVLIRRSFSVELETSPNCETSFGRSILMEMRDPLRSGGNTILATRFRFSGMFPLEAHF